MASSKSAGDRLKAEKRANAKADVMMLLFNSAVDAYPRVHGWDSRGRTGRPKRPGTAGFDREAVLAWQRKHSPHHHHSPGHHGHDYHRYNHSLRHHEHHHHHHHHHHDGRTHVGSPRPQTAFPRARHVGGPRPQTAFPRGSSGIRIAEANTRTLDGWLRSVGLGLVEAPKREPPKKPKQLSVDEKEGRAWMNGDKVLLSREQEGGRAKLQQHRAEAQRVRKKMLLKDGYENTIRTEELFFEDEEDLDRYVWAKSGKVLGPFEKVDRDEAAWIALEHEQKRRQGAGKPEDAWRLHGKAAWVADCVGEEHAKRCEDALKRGCMHADARKRAGGALFGTKMERLWCDEGKVLRSKLKQEGGGLLLDAIERLDRNRAKISSNASKPAL